VNKSQLLDIDEHEMKRIEKRERMYVLRNNGKAILLIFFMNKRKRNQSTLEE
jgi:hypothetical protein